MTRTVSMTAVKIIGVAIAITIALLVLPYVIGAVVAGGLMYGASRA